MNISVYKKQKQSKETNWKQKFQKPRNEDICLTYLNVEKKRNFHFLSLGNVTRVASEAPKRTLLLVQQSGLFIVLVGKESAKSGCFEWHYIIILCNYRVFLTGH